MTILHSQCLATELVKTANAIAINSVAGPVTGVIPPVSAPASGASVWYVDTSTTPDSLYFWDGSTWSLAGDGTGSSALLTQDEGAALGSATTMNFVGGGVTATHAAGVTTVTVPSGTVATQDEGVALGSAATLNFVGGGVTATHAAGVTTVTVPTGATTFATNAEAQAGTSAILSINPANLYARENLSAQTGLSNDITAIPAPTAGLSVWGTNLLGETLHYAPGLGWKIVDDKYGFSQEGVPAEGDTTYAAVMPRAGIISASMSAFSIGTTSGAGADVYVGISPTTTYTDWVAQDRSFSDVGLLGSYNMAVAVSADRIIVSAGQTVYFYLRNLTPNAPSGKYRFSYQYA